MTKCRPARDGLYKCCLYWERKSQKHFSKLTIIFIFFIFYFFTKHFTSHSASPEKYVTSLERIHIHGTPMMIKLPEQPQLVWTPPLCGLNLVDGLCFWIFKPSLMWDAYFSALITSSVNVQASNLRYIHHYHYSAWLPPLSYALWRVDCTIITTL